MTTWRRGLPAVVAVATLSWALSACGGGSSPSASPSSSGSTSHGSAVKAEAPKTDPRQFDPQADVHLINSAPTQGGWSAGGTVQNTLGRPATYRITVSFDSTGPTTLAVGSTAVPMAAGKTTLWSVTSKFDAPVLVICQLQEVTAG